MRKIVLLFAALAISAGFISAQEKHEMSPEQKAYMEYMAPGKMHKHLADGVGEFKTTTTFWAKQGAEPMVSEGKAEAEMILGGRYLKTVITGNMMGLPFEGMSIDGFDNAAKKFYSVWIDNFGTGIMTSVGTYDEKANSISYDVEYVNPMDGKTAQARQVIHFVDKDHQVLEMYMNAPDGSEWRSMEVKFERTKKTKD